MVILNRTFRIGKFPFLSIFFECSKMSDEDLSIEHFKKVFPERLKKTRLKKGYSQMELSKKLNTSHVNIYRWEESIHIPNSIHLFNMAKELEVSADWLMGLR